MPMSSVRALTNTRFLSKISEALNINKRVVEQCLLFAPTKPMRKCQCCVCQQQIIITTMTSQSFLPISIYVNACSHCYTRYATNVCIFGKLNINTKINNKLMLCVLCGKGFERLGILNPSQKAHFKHSTFCRLCSILSSMKQNLMPM